METTSEIEVCVFDTTLRDGEQTPGVHIKPEQKVDIAVALEAFGVGVIEAGFPVSSPGDLKAVAEVSKVVKDCAIAALCRCVIGDVDAAVEALRPAVESVIHIVLGVSDVHLNNKMSMSRADAVRAIHRTVRYARDRCARVEFSLEDATRTERPFLHQVIQNAVDAGATTINIADTVGCALPEEFGATIADVVSRVDTKVVVSAHCHNDMGMATANTVAAVQNGARQVEVTVNGVGERAGNAAIEEVGVVLALKGIASTGLDLTRLAQLSATVARITRVPVQPNKAVVGGNAFAHSSGIHQDGIIKDPRTYEFVPPSAVGVPGHTFVLTARSGRKAVAHIANTMGFSIAPDKMAAAYDAFIHAADASTGAVSESTLREILTRVTSQAVASVN